MKVSLSRDLCVGAGHCVRSAPEVFDQDEDGIAVVLVGTCDDEQEAALYEAADLCPANAICLKR